MPVVSRSLTPFCLLFRLILTYEFTGWQQESAIYAQRIIALLRILRSSLDEVLLLNNRVVQRYFQGGNWTLDLNAILYAAKFSTSYGTPLDNFVKAEMKRKEGLRGDILNKLQFGIDGMEALSLVMVGERFETVCGIAFAKSCVSV